MKLRLATVAACKLINSISREDPACLPFRPAFTKSVFAKPMTAVLGIPCEDLGMGRKEGRDTGKL